MACDKFYDMVVNFIPFKMTILQPLHRISMLRIVKTLCLFSCRIKTDPKSIMM